MENNNLEQIWSQQPAAIKMTSKQIIHKATVQHRKQQVGIAVMGITVVVLSIYGLWIFPKSFNNFSLGMLLMIGSLLVRIIIEVAFTMSKVSKSLQLDHRAYTNFLTGYYTQRRGIHMVITPLCFLTYLYGLLLLFPYFKQAFSHGFYVYCIVSATVSLLVIAVLIAVQAQKELAFLKTLKATR